MKKIIKEGDLVRIITGSFRGREGIVKKIIKKKNRIFLKDFRREKKDKIISLSFHISNVILKVDKKI